MLKWSVTKKSLKTKYYLKFIWNYLFLNYMFIYFNFKNKNDFFLLFYKYIYIYLKLFAHQTLFKNKVFLQKNILISEFKSLYKFNLLKRTDSIKVKTKSYYPEDVNKNFSKNLIRLLIIYLMLNTSISINTYKIHITQKIFYFYHSSNGIYITNFLNLIKIWKKMYYLIYNLFYFNINMLLFGSTAYKKEVFSFNFNLNKYFLKYLRYFNLYFTVEKFQINTVYKYVFYKLNLEGIKAAFILDTYHHKNSLYYLQKYYYFTIGITPLTQDITLTNFSIPIFLNTLMNQFFFYRLLLIIKKNAIKNQYLQKKKYWNLLQ
uniref:Ribosomal protein S2 n=1 Tax=Strombidium sp. TaxID=181122 RepID=A0A7T0M4I4_9SPIT|nr:ribosomal protein S2 [Strombidium sp.]